MRLRTKIPMMLLPLVVLPLVLLGILAGFKINRDMDERIDAETRTALQHASELYQTAVATARGNLQLFASHLLVEKYAVATDETTRYALLQAPLLELFARYQSAFPEYLEIRFLLPDGYEDVRLTQPYTENHSDDESQSEFFTRLRAAGTAGYAAVYRNPDTERPALYVGTPIALRDATVESTGRQPPLRGYLAVSVAIDAFSKAVQDTRIGKQGILFATDRAGRLLYGRAALPTDFPRIVNAVIDRPTPYVTDFDGAITLLRGQRLDDNLFLFAAIRQFELRELLYQAVAVVCVALLLTLVATGGGLIAALESMIVQPVRRLRTVAAEIGRGNWEVKSGIASTDEIGDLARSVEEMAANLKSADEQVRYLAYHDHLTGLPNREMFRDYLARVIAQADRTAHRLAVLFLDIDGFKRINDSLGHAAGDELLREVARRLSAQMRDEDMLVQVKDAVLPDGLLARLGGDEFIALLTNIHDVHSPATIARRFIKALTETLP